MPRRLLFCLTSRTAIGLFNILILLLLVQGVLEVLMNFEFVREPPVQHGMEDIVEGLGTILVALGVALEERETLMKFLKLYPEGLTPFQERVDHCCHGYGLILLLVGLLMEVVVYIVKMPNIPTDNIAPALLLGGTALCVLSILFLLRLTWLLARAGSDAAAGAAAPA